MLCYGGGSIKKNGIYNQVCELKVTEDMLPDIAASTFLMDGGYKTLTPDEVLHVLKKSL